MPITRLARPIDLYRNLFGALAGEISKAKHIVAVVKGPLQALPLGVLVVSKPPVKRLTAAQARATKISWFALSTSETRIPSLKTFAALRRTALDRTRQLAFLGVGDPILAQSEAAQRSLDLNQLTRSAGITDVKMLRTLASLPETALELRALGKTLGNRGSRILIQADATEHMLKTMSLAPYDIIAFATHGVVAGLVFSGSEPGLILTPPDIGTREDDGYLSMSEIASLKLNAELVILSACDTATSDGRPLADGLSGLARAFFVAGARNIVATHWEIPSLPSVAVTTNMLRSFLATSTRQKDHAGTGPWHCRRRK